MQTQPFSCRELVEIITDYLEGSLSEEDRLRFEAHLEICDGCTTYLEQMREMIRMMGRLSEESIAPEAKEPLLRAFRDWSRR